MKRKQIKCRITHTSCVECQMCVCVLSDFRKSVQMELNDGGPTDTFHRNESFVFRIQSGVLHLDGKLRVYDERYSKTDPVSKLFAKTQLWIMKLKFFPFCFVGMH